MLRMVLQFFLASLFTLCFTFNSYALCPEYRAAMRAALLDKYYQHPEYGARPGQVDCSKLIGAAAQAAGIPGVNPRPVVTTI
jgi:hypothetical protein